MKTEEEFIEIIKKAEERNDEATLAKFRPFGGSVRQQAMIYRHYQQWLSCGYEGEPVFNEYRWLINDIPEESEEEA